MTKIMGAQAKYANLDGGLANGSPSLSEDDKQNTIQDH